MGRPEHVTLITKLTGVNMSKIVKVTCPKCGMPAPLISEGYEGNLRELEFKCSCGYNWWIPAYFISTNKVQVVV